MSHDEKSAATPTQTDLAFTRESPYGTKAEPTYSGALSFLRRRYTTRSRRRGCRRRRRAFDLATTNRREPGLARARSAPPPPRWPGAVRTPGTSIRSNALMSSTGAMCSSDSGTPHRRPRRISSAYRNFRRRRRHAADAGRRSLSSAFRSCRRCMRSRTAVADPLRRPLRHLARQRRRIDHGTMFFHAARLGIVDPAVPSRSACAPTTTKATATPCSMRAGCTSTASTPASPPSASGRERQVLHQLRHRFPGSGARARHRHAGGRRFRYTYRFAARARLAGLEIVEWMCRGLATVRSQRADSLAAASIAQELLCAHASRFPDRG